MPTATINVPGFDLPPSAFLSDETRQAQRDYREDLIRLGEQTAAQCTPLSQAELSDIPAIRQREADIFYQSTLYKKLTQRYATLMQPDTIGGVYCERFTPAEGVAERNRQRVLINFHGGSFTSGCRTTSHQESIPIAAVGQVEVISVDYRLGPEHHFPAASDDAFAVYRELLNHYAPANIGLFGCSAGAMLSAQLIARLVHEKLPLPGALSMSCWGPQDITGDSNHTVAAQIGMAPYDLSNMAYFTAVNRADPLAIPAVSESLLAQFPPSLLMTATRDFVMSSVLQSHRQLVQAGVEASLYVWDGLDHAFVVNPDLPEARESYDYMVGFFEKYLQG